MTPTDMADRAREIANEFGLSVDVLDEASHGTGRNGFAVERCPWF